MGLKVSTNKIYAGQHWSKRQSAKDSFASIAAVFCRPVCKIESYPVEIRYRFFFVSKPLDTLNTAYMAKMFEDAFRALGILKEDSPKYVALSVLEVIELGRPKKPQVPLASRAPSNAQDDDYLIIDIYPYGYAYRSA
jgi:hypothetical protein